MFVCFYLFILFFSLRCSCFSKESLSEVGSLWPAASTRNDYYFNRRLSTEGETNEFHKKDFLLTDFSSLLLLPLPSSAALLCCNTNIKTQSGYGEIRQLHATPVTRSVQSPSHGTHKKSDLMKGVFLIMGVLPNQVISPCNFVTEVSSGIKVIFCAGIQLIESSGAAVVKLPPSPSLWNRFQIASFLLEL